MTVEQIMQEENLDMLIAYRGMVYFENTYTLKYVHQPEETDTEVMSFMISFGDEYNYDIAVSMTKGDTSAEFGRISQAQLEDFLQAIPQDEYRDWVNPILWGELKSQICNCRNECNEERMDEWERNLELDSGIL